jgi:branched-chain amino acid transport system ATP-binding protein
MVGGQQFDRPAENLAAEIVDGHLGSFDLAEIEVGIDAGESLGDADLERCGLSLNLTDGENARRGQSGNGCDRAGIPDCVADLHAHFSRTRGWRRRGRNLAPLDSGAKLRLIRAIAREATAEQETILEAQGLTKEFKGFVAVKNVNLRVQRHTIHALIGPNGAGKTTFFNLLTHFLTPTTGRIHFKGRDITGSSPAAIARMGLARSFQISAVFPHLSVRENVRVALQRRLGNSFQFWRSEGVLRELDGRALELVEAVGLSSFSNLPAVELPYGRKRALEIATTLALEPEMMLLDEPMAGLGQEDIKRITGLIRTVARDRTVLMVEHNMSVVADLSDTITVLARGEVLAEGPYATVSKNPLVVEAYVGTGHG